MVNNISRTPFKINQTLLDYINNEGMKHDLLIDPDVTHKFEYLEKRNKYPRGVLASHKSKVILQQTILELADFYRSFSKIYFPVRLDQRGRLYCSPSYLNYQSNELSKALLLFAEPGIINRGDGTSIAYLKAYGANCYGDSISKSSVMEKIKWVDNNITNIINYDNGTLLNKAKEKLLFLAFCIEFKRFYEFYINTSHMRFETYLPIQLDATCNGFQHMALLSNEQTLFKELNLIPESKGKDVKTLEHKPSDFYNFLLHKLINYFKSKVDSGIFFYDSDLKRSAKDKKEKSDIDRGSYKRLYDFIWNRAHVKKSIMTIPYNSSHKSMKKYLAESLVRADSNINDQTWYCVSEKDDKNLINDKDLRLLISSLQFIIKNDFEKIKKLSKYLKKVAELLNLLELPITWTLPTGLTIKQSYLQTKTTTITPFTYSKVRLNLKVTIKDKFDKNKQVRALMPNLIHSLDGTSLILLYEQFIGSLCKGSIQFFSVHDCFGTTSEKVSLLKTILASIYTDLYSSDPYLDKFEKSIIDSVESATDHRIDRETRKVRDGEGTVWFTLHDIDWVLNRKHLSKKSINKIDKIDSENILI